MNLLELHCVAKMFSWFWLPEYCEAISYCNSTISTIPYNAQRSCKLCVYKGHVKGGGELIEIRNTSEQYFEQN